METVDLRSTEDVHEYCEALSARRVQDNPRVRAWQSIKRLTWLAILAGSFLCYYLMDKMQEALLMLK